MALSLTDRWVWDFWHVADGEDHHLFYLQAPRSLADPEDRHWNVSIGHAVSRDLATWTTLPDALAPAPGPAWDDCTTWTGSVLRHDGTWWMFYTGTSHAEAGLVQRIGLATSSDLVTWTRHGDRPLIELDPRWYEELDLEVWHDQAWRDPWVFLGDDGRFHALVTARSNRGDPRTRGVIGHASSPDLLAWTTHPPICEPGMFGHLEIPQTVQLGGRWWLLFSSPAAPWQVVAHQPDAAVEGTHLVSAPDPLGPFAWSTYQLLDGDPAGSRYGGRLVVDSAGRHQLLTWLLRDPDGDFVGTISDPVPVEVRDGRLVTRA